MTVTVDVPERITRADLRRLVESLGVRLEDLTELRFGRGGIHMTVIARNANGHPYLTADQEIATHDISIPLEGD